MMQMTQRGSMNGDATLTTSVQRRTVDATITCVGARLDTFLAPICHRVLKV